MLARSGLWLAALIWASLSYTGWAEGKVWALVIGVDEYVHSSIPKLRYAVADAKLFAQALQTTLKVPKEQVFLLTSDSVDRGSEPKAVNVAYRLSWLSKTVKAEDTLIFYFAGHGLTLEGEPFLLTEEADSRSVLTLKASALHQGEVVQALRKAGVANCWLVLDACRNSPAGKGENRLSPEASRSVTSADVGTAQTATMFSCKVGERSWEWDEKSHGCFTYFLVEGMREGGADSAGRVTLQGLSQYVSDQVPMATQKFGALQNPWMLYGGPGQEKWVLATVAPPKVARGDSQTLLYVAKLEALQARLDQETARRVAAEQKARLEESKRLELQQRLALLQHQVADKAAKISATSAADVDPKGDRLLLEIQIQRQLGVVSETRLLAAKVAGVEASQRLLEAETREKLVTMESVVDHPKMAEVFVIEDRVQQLREKKVEIGSELSRLQEKKLAQLREVEKQEEKLQKMRDAR